MTLLRGGGASAGGGVATDERHAMWDGGDTILRSRTSVAVWSGVSVSYWQSWEKEAVS